MGSGLPRGTASMCVLSMVGPLLLWLGMCVVRLVSCVCGGSGTVQVPWRLVGSRLHAVSVPWVRLVSGGSSDIYRESRVCMRLLPVYPPDTGPERLPERHPSGAIGAETGGYPAPDRWGIIRSDHSFASSADNRLAGGTHRCLERWTAASLGRTQRQRSEGSPQTIGGASQAPTIPSKTPK